MASAPADPAKRCPEDKASRRAAGKSPECFVRCTVLLQGTPRSQAIGRPAQAEHNLEITDDVEVRYINSDEANNPGRGFENAGAHACPLYWDVMSSQCMMLFSSSMRGPIFLLQQCLETPALRDDAEQTVVSNNN